MVSVLPIREAAAISSRRPPAEIVSLTSLRGFLALWVVVYHFWNDLLRLFPSADIVTPLAKMGHMAVPAFFMLSGFVLAYNYADRFNRLRGSEYVRFQCLRLARVYPVHLFTLLVVAAMVWVSGLVGFQLTDAGYTARDFILNLFLVHTWVPDFKLNWNYPSWSISSEWFAYLIFPLAVAGFLRHLLTPVRATIFSGMALAGAMAVMTRWQPRPFYELVLVVPTFFAGAAVYWILRGRLGTGTSRVVRWLPELLMLAVGAACFVHSSGLAVAALLCCFLGLILVLAWLGTNCHALWSARPAAFLGEVSYSLYMTHTLAQKMIYRLLPSSRFESAEPLTRLGVVAVYAAVVIACCLGTYFVVESPSRRFFKSVMRRSARPSGDAAGKVNQRP
jgi:peptidoglycan/LPS O-acetylase OafA/YrhL